MQCEAPPEGHGKAVDEDGDDTEVNPGAEEICDGIDNDCDGEPDLVVGAPLFEVDDDPVGAAVLLPGPLFGGATADDGYVLAGTELGGWAGETLAEAGDTDGDGFSDLWIGASVADIDARDTGAAWLVLGPITVGLSLDEADVRIQGIDRYDQAGCAIAGAEEICDGVAYAVWDGQSDIPLGASTAGGDLNQDGVIDIILADQPVGEVFVVTAPATGGDQDLTLSFAVLHGDDGFGTSLAADEGRVWLVLGSSPLGEIDRRFARR